MFKQLKRKVLYGWATVSPIGEDKIQLLLRVRDAEQSTQEQTVWAKHKFVFSSDKFFGFLPKGVKELKDSNKRYFCAVSDDGEKIFQFRPYNEDSVIVRFRGFYRNDRGEIVFNEGFKDKNHLTAIFELEVAQGQWAGTIYPFRYWYVNDKKTYEPVFKVVDGDVIFTWITKPMRTILEFSGVMERSPKCPLRDTEDPQEILDWLEDEILKNKAVRFSVSIKDGYPDWDSAELLETEEDDNEDETGEDDDIEIEVHSSSKKFDEDDNIPY